MAALSLFISYAHKDEALRQQLEKHLAQLQREGLITDWHAGKVLPGEMREEEIDKHLQTASIILLLLSPDLLASDHYEKEMQYALKRHERDESYVVPIILRHCG